MAIKLTKLIDLLGCEVFTNLEDDLNKNIEYVFSCDLMSDVLKIGNTSLSDKRNVILITGLATNQTIRTAEMLDINVVCLVRGKVPSNKMIQLARESGIMLISTKKSTFTSNGLLFQKNLKGIERYI